MGALNYYCSFRINALVTSALRKHSSPLYEDMEKVKNP